MIKQEDFTATQAWAQVRTMGERTEKRKTLIKKKKKKKIKKRLQNKLITLKIVLSSVGKIFSSKLKDKKKILQKKVKIFIQT